MPKQEFLSPKEVAIFKQRLARIGKSHARIAMESGINPAYFSRRLSSGRITVAFYRRVSDAHKILGYFS